jgi:hypothetical protein
MIGGVVEHNGHQALAVHLAKAADNETIVVTTHGLASDTLTEALAELNFMSIGCRSRKPLLHVWASPSVVYSDLDWLRHREALEAEFGLIGFPSIEVTHRKLGAGGRSSEHKHFVYLRVGTDGKVARMSHSAARMEKVSRIAEVRNGERLTSGVFNDSVIAHLRREGVFDVADAMVRAGLVGTRANIAPTSSERAMGERLADLAADEVWRRAATAWRQSDSGIAFQSALSDNGLRLAMGKKCHVVVTQNGAVHPLLRAINKGGHSVDLERLRKADLAARLDGLHILRVDDLPALPAIGAGVFGITGLDRQAAPGHAAGLTGDEEKNGPTASSSQVDSLARPSEHEPIAAIDPVAIERVFTPEQIEALIELDEVFALGAYQRARQIREKIQRQVDEDIAAQREAALAQRIKAEVGRWSRPSLGQAGWKNEYKSGLAGLPRQYGPLLKWVEAKDANCKLLKLTSGVTIDLAPSVAHASDPAPETIDIMIGYAQAQGWTSVSITGGTGEWRTQMAIAATRAGLSVVNTALAEIVEAESWRLDCERLVQAWRLARHAAIESPAPTDLVRQVFADILGDIARRPDIAEFISTIPMGDMLESDLDQYRRHLQLRDERTLGVGMKT